MTLRERPFGCFGGPNWTVKLSPLRLEAAVDLMKIFGVVETAVALVGSAPVERRNWVIDWSCEGKEERRGKSRAMI